MDTVELVRVHRVPPGEMNVPAQEFARGSLQRADRRTWLHQARRWSARAVVPIVLATAMLAAGASTASAVIVHLANGRTLSYQPLRGASAVVPYDAFFHDLDYNGGPLMPSNTNYAVYWRPSGGPEYPSDYQPGLNQYLTDLAHDSGG